MGAIKYHGVYQSKKIVEKYSSYFTYIKFFPNGTLIKIDTPDTGKNALYLIESQIKVCDPEKRDTFFLEGKNLEIFASNSIGGNYKYEGIIENDNIKLNLKGNEDAIDFQFLIL